MCQRATLSYRLGMTGDDGTPALLLLQLPSALARKSCRGADATVSPATMATALRPSCSIACLAASSAATLQHMCRVHRQVAHTCLCVRARCRLIAGVRYACLSASDCQACCTKHTELATWQPFCCSVRHTMECKGRSLQGQLAIWLSLTGLRPPRPRCAPTCLCEVSAWPAAATRQRPRLGALGGVAVYTHAVSLLCGGDYGICCSVEVGNEQTAAAGSAGSAAHTALPLTSCATA